MPQNGLLPTALLLCLLTAACGRFQAAASGVPVESPGETKAAAETLVAGPRGGLLQSLGEAQLEYLHDEHWGAGSLYLYDAAMEPRAFDATPLLGVLCDDEPLVLTATREDLHGEEDGGWHFEDDALLGLPERGRLRLRVDGKTYTPAFEHVHLKHGHPTEHAQGPHTHGAGPHGGRILTIGSHVAHLEIVHNEHWGLVSLYLTNALLEPKRFDEPPQLNALYDDEPIELFGGTLNWDEEEDGGLHFEHDAFLGATDGGRFRLVVNGKTYTPLFTYVPEEDEEGPGHSHDAGATE